MASPTDEPPDIMNSPAFDPPPPPPAPRRRSTVTSQASTTGTLNPDTCRICRSEGSPSEPLFHPCKCSGSIKFVHQECLIEWLGHSNKKHCELCKTPFRFTKLYDAHMPSTLPLGVFVKRATWHVVTGLARMARLALVGAVWFGVIPWIVRWVWRWLFWLADAAWSREAFLEILQREPASSQSHTGLEWVSQALQRFFAPSNASSIALDGQQALSSLAQSVGMVANTTGNISMWSSDEPSMLSDWSYLSAMTDSKRVNRFILDVFEGQMITCVILTSFILVFLLREWVVQQQPLVNLEGMGNMQDQLREAAERMAADNERLRRQQELLDQARQRLAELQNGADALTACESEEDLPPFDGWEALERLIDDATQHLRRQGETEHELFVTSARQATRQIRAAGKQGLDLDHFTDKVYEKFSSYPETERREWEGVLVSEIEKNAISRGAPVRPENDSEEGLNVNITRPSMPDRDLSSRATHIQRLLHEVDDAVPSSERTSSESGQSRPDAEQSIGDAVNAPPGLRSAASDTDSWEHITPPNGNSNAASGALSAGPPRPQQGETTSEHVSESSRFRSIPVANAGADARINIRHSTFTDSSGKQVTQSPPRIEERMLAGDELKKDLEKEVTKELQDETSATTDDAGESADTEAGDQEARRNDNPFHPDGPDPPASTQENIERRDSESFSGRVASVFREEFGLDEIEDLGSNHQTSANANGETPPNEGNAERPTSPPENGRPEQSLFAKVVDWFWGDIRPANTQEPAPPVREELQHVDDERREGEQGQEAPFVPLQNGQAAAPQQPQPQPQAGDQGEANDPEVLAAAQQAGLDAEAIEDAEDLEGIFELIGVQGPLIGLFQTSAFCMLLVACTIAGAVFAPYVWGKVCLSLVANPVYFVIVMPLQIASFLADLVIDTVLMLGGWAVMVFALSIDWTLSFIEAIVPAPATGKIWERLVQYSGTAASKAGERLANLIVTGASSSSNEELNWAFLGASVHAHGSLKTIQGEIRSVLDFAGHMITALVDAVSSGTVLQQLGSAVKHVPALASSLLELTKSLPQRSQPLVKFLADLSRGRLHFTKPEVPLDPSLVYWSTSDRAYAIFAGYAALATLAAIYVAIDMPITNSPQGQKREKQVRDSLRQAGGVLKVILIISIEMLVFPLYCGLLLDLAFLPLFHGVSVRSRWEYATAHPWSFCFVHWFVGTCYMFHFALFVGMCRKILRKGVLWFIRDPDDPNFHPVRDVLEKNVLTQLRKIAFSALVYGALVILCLGGVIWSIGKLFNGIFPIHWTSTEPVLEFPMDLLLYNFATPLVIRLFRPSKVINAMYAWWLRRCARVLRLSHFLFDDRKKDEEGYNERLGGWRSLLRLKSPSAQDSTAADEGDAPTFRKSGTYVLTPCNDSYRPPKPDEAFLHSDGSDVYIADKDGKRNEHFAKVYVPPYFRVRIALFMVCLWAFSAFIGLCGTLVPLVFGRRVFKGMVGEQGLWVNDIYAYILGAYVLGGSAFILLKGRQVAEFVKAKAREVEVRAAFARVAKVSMRALRCAYVYGFLGLVLPMLMALTLHFYFVLPLATYAVSVFEEHYPDTPPADTATVNSTTSLGWTLYPPEQAAKPNPTLADHSLHLFQEHALGILYIRLLSQLVLTTPTSRAAEAFRRVTRAGYLNPDPRLATRYFIFPLTLLGTLLLLGPPAATELLLALGRSVSRDFVAAAEAETKMFRYSYAFCAGVGFTGWGLRALGKATARWRARIKDEVYLVGERLHNFGESRPPVGTRSVVRKGSR